MECAEYLCSSTLSPFFTYRQSYRGMSSAGQKVKTAFTDEVILDMERTIAAISSALHPSGIGIIRVSGTNSISIVSKIYRSKGGKKNLHHVDSHTIHHGFIVHREEILDEVLVIVMKAPRTYTGEDTVEIDCHGGVIAMKKVLNAVLESGAFLAEPGEFSKRAFLNGRMDLTQAEAVMSLIQAKNERAFQNSLEQLKGGFAEKIRGIRKEVLHETAFIESALDDPEHYSLDGYRPVLEEIISRLSRQIDHLLKTYEDGKRVEEGIRTVILGKPNAGKSSLLNYMLGEDRAIVTKVAGTTRDTLEEYVNIGDVSLKLVDTAGIHQTDNLVEKIGIGKARQMAEKADLILYVADSSTELDQDDLDILNFIREKKTIILYNKTDLDPVMDMKALKNQTSGIVIPFSAKEKEGLRELIEEIHQLFFHGEISSQGDFLVTSARHQTGLCAAKKALDQVLEGVKAGIPEDLFCVDLMDAYTELGRILGEEVGDDLIDEIFSSFCMGK